MRDTVPSLRYSPVCNVLRQWKTSLIPTYRVYRLYDICDRLYINHPFTTKCNFWVRPKLAAMSAQDRYSVIGMGIIYGVLAILCRGMKHRLHIVNPRHPKKPPPTLQNFKSKDRMYKTCYRRPVRHRYKWHTQHLQIFFWLPCTVRSATI